MGEQRTGIVTGANSGIGLETARGLAAAGFRTVLLCRNAERAEAARADIASTHPDAELHVVLCDLSLQADVHRAAAEIAERFDRLDVLVNNAGFIHRAKATTSEGIDASLAVNHLGPFLLTGLLRPLLEASAPSRVVTVASDAHKFRKLDVDDLQAERRGYGVLGMPRYGETKKMNILFTRELARRLDGTGVTANAVHPGGVRTKIGAPGKVVSSIVGLFLKSPEVGARTSLTCALDPALAGVTGGYFYRSEPADRRLDAQARDNALAAVLWERSEALVDR